MIDPEWIQTGILVVSAGGVIWAGGRWTQKISSLVATINGQVQKLEKKVDNGFKQNFDEHQQVFKGLREHGESIANIKGRMIDIKKTER